jgi:hypothetical protein
MMLLGTLIESTLENENTRLAGSLWVGCSVLTPETMIADDDGDDDDDDEF